MTDSEIADTTTIQRSTQLAPDKPDQKQVHHSPPVKRKAFCTFCTFCTFLVLIASKEALGCQEASRARQRAPSCRFQSGRRIVRQSDCKLHTSVPHKHAPGTHLVENAAHAPNIRAPGIILASKNVLLPVMKDTGPALTNLWREIVWPQIEQLHSLPSLPSLHSLHVLHVLHVLHFYLIFLFHLECTRSRTGRAYLRLRACCGALQDLRGHRILGTW